MTTMRFYVQDATGIEVQSGLVYVGAGPWADGVTGERREFYALRRREDGPLSAIETARQGQPYQPDFRRVKIWTVADFGGQPVRVKLWHKTGSEWFALVP